MNILIRDVPESLVRRLDDEAARRKMSRQEFLATLLAEWAEPPVVLGWFKAQRNGELSLAGSSDDEPAECHECGQPLDEVWIGILSNGAIHGPVCSGCATSE